MQTVGGEEGRVLRWSESSLLVLRFVVFTGFFSFPFPRQESGNRGGDETRRSAESRSEVCGGSSGGDPPSLKPPLALVIIFFFGSCEKENILRSVEVFLFFFVFFSRFL